MQASSSFNLTTRCDTMNVVVRDSEDAFLQSEPVQRRRACRPCFAGLLAWALAGVLLIGTGLPGEPPWYYCRNAVQGSLPEKNASEQDLDAWTHWIVEQMWYREKQAFVRGVGYGVNIKYWEDDWEKSWTSGDWDPKDGYYTGNVWAVPRLALPSITMSDGTQGFETRYLSMVDRVTAFPCALAVAATWNVGAVSRFAAAIGTEFRAKGANLALAPNANVIRVAKNGLNAAMVSGEDQYFGAKMVSSFVRGIQEVGVASAVKYFSLYSQQTNRRFTDSVADERIRWEVYYRPFLAAVDAGVAAVMCSYSDVNGRPVCQDALSLKSDLKGHMKFHGWVMSDWFALRSEDAALAGTDQNMPGNDDYFRRLGQATMDKMVERILKGMVRSGAWEHDPCRVACDCHGLLHQLNATSDDHAAIARGLAAEGAVLLKNDPLVEGGTPALPLKAGQKVAVLGDACVQETNVPDLMNQWEMGTYYVMGGSGRVLSTRPASVANGLEGRDLILRVSPTQDFTEALAALQDADVAVICAGSTSGDGQDRASLLLDQSGWLDSLLEHTSTSNISTVVVALAPGAFLAPWRHKTQALLVLFLSGQETGRAAGDLMLGDVTPSGKLPVTIPLLEADTIEPCIQNHCEYTEGLFAGWHVYDNKAVAYPFGHGLSYTTFGFSIAEGHLGFHFVQGPDQEVMLAVIINITNLGSARGAEVAQLYWGYDPQDPNGDGRPEKELLDFHKTRVLEPQEWQTIQFNIAEDQLTWWSPTHHHWAMESISVATRHVWVGSSSRDLRLCGRFGGAARRRTVVSCNSSDTGSSDRHRS